MNLSPDALSASTRIDAPHTVPVEDVHFEGVTVDDARIVPVRRRRVRSEAKTVKVAGADATEPSEAEATPHFIVEPPDAVPEIVVNHAYDLSLHLAERLREVERRELAAAEYETKLQEAEAGARVWVCQRDMELSALERELQLKNDEINTQAAAVAAAEIAAEQEFCSQQAVLRQREAELDQLAAELTDREERLHSERSALDQALDKLRAQRRRDEELQRSRQQKWQVLLEGDRAQAERTLINLQKHRLALEERERALNAHEQAPPALSLRTAEGRREEHQDLSLSVLRAEAARDHRLALEHRWIAGQLWARLAGSALASDDELQDSLENVRSQLEMMYRREREALEDLQSSLADTVRQIQPAPREVRSRSKPRTLAFTG